MPSADPDADRQRAIKEMTDAELQRAYQATDGEPGNPKADALLDEIVARGLDA